MIKNKEQVKKIKEPLFFYMFIILAVLIQLILLINSSILITSIYIMIVFGITIILFIYFILCGDWAKINRHYLENISTEINIKDNKKYVGVIIASGNLRFWKYPSIYNGGLLLLIEYLRNQNKSIKIIKNSTTEQFNKLVYDKNCNELYIIGHGRKYGLKISKKEFVNYNQFKGAPRKDLVVQLTCQHKAGESLAEILHAKEEFIMNRTINTYDTINYLLEKIECIETKK